MEAPSGIKTKDDGQRYVGGSVRPDGTVRKTFKVRPGFVPLEDQLKYVPRMKRLQQERLTKEQQESASTGIYRRREDVSELSGAFADLHIDRKESTENPIRNETGLDAAASELKMSTRLSCHISVDKKFESGAGALREGCSAPSQTTQMTEGNSRSENDETHQAELDSNNAPSTGGQAAVNPKTQSGKYIAPWRRDKKS